MTAYLLGIFLHKNNSIRESIEKSWVQVADSELSRTPHRVVWLRPFNGDRSSRELLLADFSWSASVFCGFCGIGRFSGCSWGLFASVQTLAICIKNRHHDLQVFRIGIQMHTFGCSCSFVGFGPRDRSRQGILIRIRRKSTAMRDEGLYNRAFPSI